MSATINGTIQEIRPGERETLGSDRKPVIEPRGLFSLLNQFRRKELRRSIALINRFLETLGRQLGRQGISKPSPPLSG